MEQDIKLSKWQLKEIDKINNLPMRKDNSIMEDNIKYLEYSIDIYIKFVRSVYNEEEQRKKITELFNLFND